MSEDKPEEKKEKPERKFSQEQYDMLLRCSEKKDMTEWDEWREANPGVDFSDVNLEGWRVCASCGKMTEAGVDCRTCPDCGGDFVKYPNTKPKGIAKAAVFGFWLSLPGIPFAIYSLRMLTYIFMLVGLAEEGFLIGFIVKRTLSLLGVPMSDFKVSGGILRMPWPALFLLGIIGGMLCTVRLIRMHKGEKGFVLTLVGVLIGWLGLLGGLWMALELYVFP